MASSAVNKNDIFYDLLAIEEACEAWLGISPLRPDAKLLLLIAARGSVTIKEAMHNCTLSNRSFYQMIDRLKKNLKISVVSDETDRRVNRILLDEDVLTIPDSVTSKVSKIGCMNICRLNVEFENKSLFDGYLSKN